MSWEVGDYNPEMVSDMDSDVMASMQAIILGRITNQLMAQYWLPAKIENEGQGVDEMNIIPQILFSHKFTNAGWGLFDNVSLQKEIVPAKIVRLNNQSEKPMVHLGSASIFQQYIRIDLIDEYALRLDPEFFWEKPFLINLNPIQDTRLIKSRVYPNGGMKLIQI